MTHVHLCVSQDIGKLELIRMDPIPDKFAMNKHVECKLDHVPWGWSFVLHHVQCHGNMGVAVVTTKVMLKQGKQKLTFNLAVYWLYKHYCIINVKALLLYSFGNWKDTEKVGQVQREAGKGKNQFSIPLCISHHEFLRPDSIIQESNTIDCIHEQSKTTVLLILYYLQVVCLINSCFSGKVCKTTEGKLTCLIERSTRM